METAESSPRYLPPPLFSRVEALDPGVGRCAVCNVILVRVGGGPPRCAVAIEHPVVILSVPEP